MSNLTPTSWSARIVAVAGLLMLLTVAAGCGESTADSADDGNESANAAATSAVIPTVSGGEIDFGSVEGTDTVLWFWAPW